MARKLRYPAWSDWLAALESGLKTVLTKTGLVGYTLNGTRTNLKVPIKSADNIAATLPYVEIVLANVYNGWDDQNSGQPNYDEHEYTSIDSAGVKLVKSKIFIRERLEFSIDVYTQKNIEALTVAQTIRRYFGELGEFTIEWNGEDLPVYTRLHDYSFEAVEADRKGKIEYFRATWLLTLSILSEQSDADTLVSSIQSVVMDITETIDDGVYEHNTTYTVE